MDETIGDTRDEYTELLNVYWPIGVATFLIILVLVVLFVWRFRSEDRKWTKSKAKSTSEEVYAGFLVLVVAVLLFFTYDTMSDIEGDGAGAQPPERPVEMTVDVTAAKWNWRFEYPELGIVEQGSKGFIPTLVVPEDTPIGFEQTSVDVIHSFWIPHLRFKRDAFPSRTTTFTLRFPDRGFFRQGGECAEFCGLDHSEMVFHVRVLGEEEFREWARERGAS